MSADTTGSDPEKSDEEMMEKEVAEAHEQDTTAATAETAAAASSMDTEDDDDDDDDTTEQQQQQDTTATSSKPTKKKSSKKKQYSDWPMKDIETPHEHDVMYGRGGGTNHHPGNKRYRKMVEDRKLDYVNSKRLDKPLVALDIIRQWREQDPPGRFLKLDENTGLWNDVGDKKAREKTSQALREKAPLIRKQQEEEQMGTAGGADDGEEEEVEPKKTDSAAKKKSTRFAAGTNAQKDTVKKGVLTRDHSLGREYLHVGEAVTLEGFSWQDPFQEDSGTYPRTSSQGSYPGAPYPPHAGPPHGRVNSRGSMGAPPPPPHHFSGPPYNMSSGDERHRQYSATGRYESWGSVPPPPMPGYGAPYPHTRSGSWSASMGGPPPRDHSFSSMGGPPLRDHSFSQNPLRDATVSMPAAPFDGSRGSSGYWQEPPPLPHYGSYPPSRENSRSRYPSGPMSPSGGPPQYSVDPVIAQTWSGGGSPSPTGAAGPGPHAPWGEQDPYARGPPPPPPYAQASARKRSPERRRPQDAPLEVDNLERPHTVKRMTSHQYENVDTKPDLTGTSVKRAALNRDNSLASNRLKAAYLNENANRGMFDSEKEVRTLSGDLQQATLGSSKPKRLSASERMSTIDKIAMDLMVKPEPLSINTRSSTIEALSLDFDDDPLLRAELLRTSTEGSYMNGESMPRPGALTAGARLSTNEFLDIVNAPLGDDEDEPIPLSKPELQKEVSVSEWLKDI